jgi:hypothetical protein
MKLLKTLTLLPLSALLFACAGEPDPIGGVSSSSASSVPVTPGPSGKLISDINFPDPLMAQCVAATGATVVSEVTTLECSGNITNVTGISELTSLATFELANSLVTSVDLSSNSALSMIQFFNNNEMTSLIPPTGSATNGVRLYVYIEGGQVSSLDFSQNLWLTNLSVKNTVLESIDLDGNTLLSFVSLQDNPGIECSSIQAVRAINPPSISIDSADEASCSS